MIKKQIKLIGFDLDGTILNSVPDLCAAINFALDNAGLTRVTEEQVTSWVGNGMQVLLDRAVASKELSGSQITKITADFHAFYKENSCNLSYLYANAIEILKYLKAKEYLIAMITNKGSQYLPEILSHFNIKEYFSAILGSQDVPVLKPHPAAIFSLCGQFGLYPQEILFVGDSKNDVLIAKNAGCPVVAVNYGYNYGVPINESNPDWVIDDLIKIKDIV